MNFETSDELHAVRDSLARVLADHDTSTHRQARAGDPTAYAAQAWKEIAGLGLTGLRVPEVFGGLDFQVTDLLPLFHELGRALTPLPFLSTSVLGATVLRACSDTGIQRRVLPPLAAGSLQVACPYGLAPDASGVRAQAQESGWRLEGELRHIPYAASADWLVLPACTGDGVDGRVGLFLAARQAPGVRLRPHRLIDATPAADIHLESAEAIALCAPGSAQARELMEAVNAAGIAAACAQMVGAMQASLCLSVDYVKTRQQFGRAIGENQAVRHKIAEMLVALETARSMSIAAAVAARDGGFARAQTGADLHRAKFLVGRNARAVCHAAIQLHGGMGMTEEYAVGHYLRHVHVLDRQFGDGASHVQQLARMG